jgi:hypothetical protein
MDTKKEFITIYFSKDRPLQLDLALSSSRENSLEWGIQEEAVLFDTSDERIEKAYKQVSEEHPNVHFIKQNNFKSDLLECIGKRKYFMSIVDDTIFLRPYSITDIAYNLKTLSGVLGVSLRLGKNTTWCYPTNSKNEIPELEKIILPDLYFFDWTSVKSGDFAYPLDLSSSAYKTDYLLPILEDLDYNNPNELEWLLYINKAKFLSSKFLLCYETSIAFSNPINKVNPSNTNRSGKDDFYSVENLLKEYENGKRADYNKFRNFVPSSCHQEERLEFREK